MLTFDLLGRDLCASLTRHFWDNWQLHQRWPDMPGIKRVSVNDMAIMRPVQEAIFPLVQESVGGRCRMRAAIKPSYSFTAAYERGSSLPAHTDRAECIFNVTLMLGSSHPDVPLSSWPLYVQVENVVHTIELNAGQAVLYSGTRDRHWRDVMPEPFDWVLGVFFHFVPRDEPQRLDRET